MIPFRLSLFSIISYQSYTSTNGFNFFFWCPHLEHMCTYSSHVSFFVYFHINIQSFAMLYEYLWDFNIFVEWFTKQILFDRTKICCFALTWYNAAVVFINYNIINSYLQWKKFKPKPNFYFKYIIDFHSDIIITGWI